MNVSVVTLPAASVAVQVTVVTVPLANSEPESGSQSTTGFGSLSSVAETVQLTGVEVPSVETTMSSGTVSVRRDVVRDARGERGRVAARDRELDVGLLQVDRDRRPEVRVRHAHAAVGGDDDDADPVPGREDVVLRHQLEAEVVELVGDEVGRRGQVGAVPRVVDPAADPPLRHVRDGLHRVDVAPVVVRARLAVAGAPGAVHDALARGAAHLRRRPVVHERGAERGADAVRRMHAG